MQQNARLIIPLWGKVYADKLTSMTLPALLAPGNLPALCAMFNVEVVIVTETRLFDLIRGSRSFQRVATFCPVTLTPIDDLMSSLPGDYGVVLTKALYRGFLDLGPKVTETFLLFLNADFIIADGSYRHLGELMLAGHRVIHSPSFRVVLEEVWPTLVAGVDAQDAVLAVPPRELVKLALDHKHLTVKARTVNQQLYHQWCMDQFYWYVDEDTFIGYQWPLALVAIKPECVVKEPSLVWDFGYIPDAAPTLHRYFIQDSDDFFMLEPQSKLTGEELIRPGWIPFDEVVKFLNDYTTREQRECGQQLLVLHADDLPPDLDKAIEESRRYMREITRRLSSTPQSHLNHRMLGAWFAHASERISETQTRAPALIQTDKIEEADLDTPDGADGALRRKPEKGIIPKLSYLASVLQEKMFGTVPLVGRTHPLWVDTAEVAARLAVWRGSGRDRILWLSSKDSFFRSVMAGRAQSPQLLLKGSQGPVQDEAPYNACLCELSLSELSSLPALYAKISEVVEDRAEILIYLHTLGRNPLRANPFAAYAEPRHANPFAAYEELFPAVDASTVRFHGNATTALIRKIFLNGTRHRHFAHRPRVRAVMAAITLLALAPFAWLANSQAARRDASRFAPRWTSAVLHFVVKKKRKSLPAVGIGQIGSRHQGRPRNDCLSTAR
jgi:hypothetical protein